MSDDSANVVQTIEEAWAALPEGARLNARALALAVLEEATPDHAGNGAPQCDPCLDTIALRARIAALAPAQEE